MVPAPSISNFPRTFLCVGYDDIGAQTYKLIPCTSSCLGGQVFICMVCINISIQYSFS